VIALDSSALVAIVLKESEGSLFFSKTLETDINVLSAANLLETRMVLFARDARNIRDLDTFLDRLRVIIEPVTVEQSGIAFEAFRRFGRGSGHAAGLNFGDCFAYALAKARDVPLLYKGIDFSHTDIRAAV